MVVAVGQARDVEITMVVDNKIECKPIFQFLQLHATGIWANNSHGLLFLQPTWTQWPASAVQTTPWVVPPCPFPTFGWSNSPIAIGRCFGPRAQHNHQAQLARQDCSSFYALRDISKALYTLSLSLSTDQQYMDTRVTSHMIVNGGTLSSISI